MDRNVRDQSSVSIRRHPTSSELRCNIAAMHRAENAPCCAATQSTRESRSTVHLYIVAATLNWILCSSSMCRQPTGADLRIETELLLVASCSLIFMTR